MRKLCIALVCAVVLLASCATALAGSTGGVVNVFNWEEYISQEAVDLFEQETGIKVNMMNFTTNEDMMPQVRTSPSSFDVVVPSDYAIERLINEGLLDTLNLDNIPNIKYLDPNLKNPSYDPNGLYSVPYMWGTVGILYNTKMVDEDITSWSVLFDTKYLNNVFMQDSVRDSMGVALKYLGYSMNSLNPIEITAARDLLLKQKQDGIVKAYQFDEIKDKMVAGEAALSVLYSGDAQYAIDLNEDLAYVVPIEGSNIWVDGMVIPKGAKNKENAEIFINFMCRPDIGALNCNEIWYSTPNLETVQLMGEDYIDNLTINPSQDIVDRCEFFTDVGEFITIYTTLWESVKSAK